MSLLKYSKQPTIPAQIRVVSSEPLIYSSRKAARIAAGVILPKAMPVPHPAGGWCLLSPELVPHTYKSYLLGLDRSMQWLDRKLDDLRLAAKPQGSSLLKYFKAA